MNTSAEAMIPASMNARPRVDVLVGAVGTDMTAATANGYAATYAKSAIEGTGGGAPRTRSETAVIVAPTPQMDADAPSKAHAWRRRPSDRWTARAQLRAARIATSAADPSSTVSAATSPPI